mgnify:FL=1|tara:strand:- start:136 stop:432 length:297 start_codon:yes stop_codon:yes gene_type:complete
MKWILLMRVLLVSPDEDVPFMEKMVIEAWAVVPALKNPAISEKQCHRLKRRWEYFTQGEAQLKCLPMGIEEPDKPKPDKPKPPPAINALHSISNPLTY